MKLTSLQDVFEEQLKDLYSAEDQLSQALPKMAEAASSQELKSAFQQHLQETKNQRDRLEQIGQMASINLRGVKCKAMEGLIKEAQDLLSENEPSDALDVALIASAQRIEHYEIAGYGSTRTYAKRLGHSDAEKLLQETLDEEGATDKKLTQIAESTVNKEAMVS